MPQVPGNPTPPRPDIPDFWYDLAIANMIEMGRLKDPDRMIIDKDIVEEKRDVIEKGGRKAPELGPENERFTTDQGAPGLRTKLKAPEPMWESNDTSNMDAWMERSDKALKEHREKQKGKDPYTLSPRQLRERGLAK